MPPAPSSAKGAAAPIAIVLGPPWLHAGPGTGVGDGVGTGVGLGVGVGVFGGGGNGVGVAPGASVGTVNVGTLQLGHAPPLHAESAARAASVPIRRAGKNNDFLSMFMVLSGT